MFEQYSVKCQNPYCQAFLSLPSEQEFINGNVYELDTYPEEQLWPPEEWRANLACSRCGAIREYESEEVEAFYWDERRLQPKCLRVDMGCKAECRLAVHFFIAEIAQGSGWGRGDDLDLNSDMVPLLRRLLQREMPKGSRSGKAPR